VNFLKSVGVVAFLMVIVTLADAIWGTLCPATAAIWDAMPWQQRLAVFAKFAIIYAVWVPVYDALKRRVR